MFYKTEDSLSIWRHSFTPSHGGAPDIWTIHSGKLTEINYYVIVIIVGFYELYPAIHRKGI